MAIEKKELAKVKIRLKQLVGSNRLPIELTILPRVKAIFDENAITEVTESQARMLMGPGHAAEGWEIIKEEKSIPKVEAAPVGKAVPRTPKTQPVADEANKEFLDKVRG